MIELFRSLHIPAPEMTELFGTSEFLLFLTLLFLVTFGASKVSVDHLIAKSQNTKPQT